MVLPISLSTFQAKQYLNWRRKLAIYVLCVMSQISHNIRVALQSDLWMRSDISIYRRRWQPLSVHLRSHPAHDALLFATSVWVLLRPTGLCERFIVLIREDLKV